MLPSFLRFTFQFRGSLALSLAALALALAGSACGGSRPGDWKLGEALAIRTPERVVAQKVAYNAAVTVQGEVLGIATGTGATFGPAASVPLLPQSEAVKVDGVFQSRGTDYTIDYDKGTVTFQRPPAQGEVSIDYTPFVKGEALGAASGTRTSFGPVAFLPIYPGSEIVRVGNQAQTRDANYTIDYQKGTVTFFSPPQEGKVTIDYQRQGHFVLLAQDGNELYIVRVVIHNSKANFLSLQAEENTVQLLGKNNLEWNALDPFGKTRQQVEAPPADSDKYVPFVWGTFNLPLGYQIDGWLVFEVPAGTKPITLRWDTGDTILLDL